jgi:hypothetical protein
LGLSKSPNSVEGIEQVSGFGMRIDGERFVGTVQQRGGRKSELGFAQPGLTANQKWSIGGEGTINRVLLVIAQ